MSSVPVAAQAAPVLPAAGDSVLQLYLTGTALPAPMTTDFPASDTAQKKSIVASAINPGLGTTIAVATFKASAEFTFTSDVVVSLYLGSENTAFYDQIQANLDGSSAATGNTKLSGATFGTAVTNIKIGIATRGFVVKAGAHTLNLLLFGGSANGSPTDIYLYFGGAKQPTGLAGSISSPDAFATSANAEVWFLADKSLTHDVPTATADKSAAVPTSGCTGACGGLSGQAEYGKGVATRDMTIAGDTILTLWLGNTAGAGAARGFTGQLTIGKTIKQYGFGTFGDSWSSSAAKIYRFCFDTKGIEVKAGDPITFSFALWSTTEASSFVLQYGSVGKPAGLMMPVAGGPASSGPSAAPAISLSTDNANLTGEAGGFANGTVVVNNGGTSGANVTLTATGDLSASFDADGLVAAAPGATNANFSVDLSSAQPGRSYNVTLHATVEGAEVANLTYRVAVTAPAPSGSAAASASSTPSSSSGGNGSALETRKEQGVPGLEVPLVVGGLAAALATVRRRRCP